MIGPINHNHEPKTGVSMAAKISKEVNKRAIEDVFTSASVIVIEVLYYFDLISFHLMPLS